MIIKGVCKCDIDLIQQFIKQEVNIKWLILSDYNTVALFCSISLYFINENRFKQSPSQAGRCASSFKHRGVSFMNERFVFKWI